MAQVQDLRNMIKEKAEKKALMKQKRKEGKKPRELGGDGASAAAREQVHLESGAAKPGSGKPPVPPSSAAKEAPVVFSAAYARTTFEGSSSHEEGADAYIDSEAEDKLAFVPSVSLRSFRSSQSLSKNPEKL